MYVPNEVLSTGELSTSTAARFRKCVLPTEADPLSGWHQSVPLRTAARSGIDAAWYSPSALDSPDEELNKRLVRQFLGLG
jgi:hypothetical protein